MLTLVFGPACPHAVPCTHASIAWHQVKKIKKQIEEEEEEENGEEEEEEEAPCNQNVLLSYIFGTVCDGDGKLGSGKFKEDEDGDNGE